MPPDALAADATHLSIDEAVAALDAGDEKEEQAAPEQAVAAEGTNTEAEPAAEDASEPETATDGEDAETEDAEEAEEAELPAIEPPRFWDAEAKARFNELPRDLQELVLAKETERDKVTSKALQDAAEKRKAADGEASKIAQINGVLDKLLPQAVETFKSRWEGVDWNAVIDQHGADQALKLRNQMEQEQGQLQQLQAAKSQAEQVQFAKFVEAETAKLPELCPDLVDPQKGNERRQELGKYLIQSGVPAESLRHMSALETSIAYKAHLFDKAQAEAKAKSLAPKPVPKPAAVQKPSVRATAAPSSGGSPQLARLKGLEAAFEKNPSKANLEALLEAQGT